MAVVEWTFMSFVSLLFPDVTFRKVFVAFGAWISYDPLLPIALVTSCRWSLFLKHLKKFVQ